MFKSLQMKKVVALLSICFMFFLVSCYRDKVEELHPTTDANCDTANISYSQTIVPIMNANCVSCHSGPSPKGNILLDNYAGFKKPISNGSLIGSITFDSLYVPMPEGATKPIDNCYIKKIKAWVHAGAPNN